MNTTNSAVLTGVVVTTGRWAEGKGVSIRVVTGAVILAVSLAVLGDVNSSFAEAMGALILVVAVMRYAVPIITKTGVTK